MSERLVTPEDFATDYPPARIIGWETECDVRNSVGGHDNGIPDINPARLVRPDYVNAADFSFYRARRC